MQRKWHKRRDFRLTAEWRRTSKPWGSITRASAVGSAAQHYAHGIQVGEISIFLELAFIEPEIMDGTAGIADYYGLSVGEDSTAPWCGI